MHPFFRNTCASIIRSPVMSLRSSIGVTVSSGTSSQRWYLAPEGISRSSMKRSRETLRLLLPDNTPVTLRIPGRPLGSVRDLDAEVIQQPNDPRFLFEIDLLDFVIGPMVIRMGPAEEEERRYPDRKSV